MSLMRCSSRWATTTALLLCSGLALAQTIPLLEVQKFEDLNSNQGLDPGEPGLNGWTITVFDNTDPNNPVEVASAVTADRTLPGGAVEPGWAVFDLPEGEYLVCETIPAGEDWLNTTNADNDLCLTRTLSAIPDPGPGPETATIAAGSSSYEVALVAQQDETWTYQVTELSGGDLTSWGLSELGSCLERIVQVDPGALVDTFFGEVVWNTPDLDGSGEFSITLDAVYPETTPIAAEVANAMDQGSAPIRGPDCGDSVIARFGNTRPVANLVIDKYADLDRDGTRGPDEPGLNGWEFVVSDSAANVVASGSTRTAPDGEDGFLLFRLPPGDYEVCETPQTNWVNSDPGVDPICESVTLPETDAVIDAPGFQLAFGFLPDVGGFDFQVELVDRVGATWIYRVDEVGFTEDLDHWNLGIASCLDNIVTTTPAGVTGIDTSAGDFEGIRWNVDPDFTSGFFSITLDADYPSTPVDALFKSGDNFTTDSLQGPDCDQPPRGETRLAFGNWFDDTSANPDSKHAAVLLDRTGSMLAFRSTGNTRCQDALELAKTDVESFFLANPETEGSSLSVWVFGGRNIVNLTGGFVDEATALAALNQLSPTGCSGVTPLADALCEVSDALVQTFPNAGRDDLLLAVSSDGGENASSGVCAGPYSPSDTPPYTPGSWQNLVYTRLIDRNVVDVRYWDDFASVTKSEDGTVVDRETGKSLSANKFLTDLNFFQALAQASGGEFILMEDGLSVRFPAPIAIPTLSGAAMVVLLAILGIAGVVVMRRRQA